MGYAEAALKGYLAFHVHCKHVDDISPCINSVSAAFFLYGRHCRCIESEETDAGEDFPRLALPFSDLVRAITVCSPERGTATPQAGWPWALQMMQDMVGAFTRVDAVAMNVPLNKCVRAQCWATALGLEPGLQMA